MDEILRPVKVYIDKNEAAIARDIGKYTNCCNGTGSSGERKLSDCCIGK